MPRTSRSTVSLQPQPTIHSFGRATKAGVTPVLSAKKPATLPVSPSKKRKLQELENFDNAGRQSVDEEANTPSKTLKFSQLTVASPRSGHYASPKRTPSRRTRVSTVAATVPEVPDTPSKKRTVNPEEAISDAPLAPRAPCVNDFLNLHSAFVQALSIHIAHNGPVSPADFREFLPSVTRIWKKRKVQPKDLQRLLWVWERSIRAKDVAYRLANYGLGKVCLERHVQIDEQPSVLQDAFEQALDLLWEQTEPSLETAKEEDRPALFLESLGLTPIHESLTPFTAFKKGQQRLQDLRSGVIRMKTEKLRAETEASEHKSLASPLNRRQSLLDRIKNKELRQSKLPPAPTKKEMTRRSAADHIEEVAGILALLRPPAYTGTGIKALFASQRKPFKMDTMIDHVRDSVRSPIPREEVEACLEILADPRVAGHWVTMVTVKDIRSVVLKSCKDIEINQLGAKVAQVKAEWEKPSACTPSIILKI
ncbi:Uncharacterized protein PECH_008888 [Penicillium ucsense]|uniref:DNA replication factor Cdt1 C-terminal domain-containing protein n=1 Tax=Penicillium ucsense TaxID=2839758 RepID=A0A8J8WB32_9EURO|nr:Uncharacterized protein PECM_004482 [Penicillium ucsense]KAF7733816.1 Uncharacterized protein PECH_008888 [Penicillium ucsense]